MICRIRFARPFVCQTAIAAVLVVTFAAGCGSREGSVTGSVYHRGVPVVAGHVNFFDPSRGKGARGALNAAGLYALDGTLPPGEYQVYVTPPSPPLPRADDRAPQLVRTPEGAPLPKRYTSPETSGTLVSVTSGQNEIVVTLGE
jgi:hypothetical protein